MGKKLQNPRFSFICRELTTQHRIFTYIYLLYIYIYVPIHNRQAAATPSNTVNYRIRVNILLSLFMYTIYALALFRVQKCTHLLHNINLTSVDRLKKIL